MASLSDINDAIWLIALVLSLIVAIVITVKTKGIHIRILNPKSHLHPHEKDKVSTKITSMEAFFIGLGNHLGVGNIAGIASAIMAGGPGAVFWIWIFAFFNAAIAFAESVLSQIYRSRDKDGFFFGGPAYYIMKGLNSRNLALIISVAGVLLYLSNISIQTSSAVNAITTALNTQSASLILAISIAILFAASIFYGAKEVAKLSSKIVPVMAVTWMLFALFTIGYNAENLPNSFAMIFGYAFNPPAVIGGGIGYAILIAVRRATYSNDAGTGSIGRISAMADSDHPVRQGMLQAMGVYVCTLFMCTITALVILSYGSYDEIRELGLNYAPLVQEIMARTALGDFAKYIIAAVLFAFAYTTIISCYIIGMADVKFLKDSKRSLRLWFIASVAIVIIGGSMQNATAEAIVDICTAGIVVINVCMIYLLKDKVLETIRDYLDQRKKGIESPTFTKDALSDPSGVTEWDADGGSKC